ncbi:ABC transporter permease [Methyloraptor flagellatus]|uniref:Iron ABC transporter permease n=1 Tax=Methyloraptor flagellatus TaxID=3162530 RepID=A0AAU7XBY9_9HYPH
MSLATETSTTITTGDIPPLAPATRADRPWIVAVAVVAALAVAPLAAILAISTLNISGETGATWAHLLSTVLPGTALTTVLLMVGVGLVTAVVGTVAAWIVAMCRFPGRGVFEWALLLPLAIPTYIVAYVHVELLDFTGPVQGAIRAVFGFKSARDYWFPDIRSLPSAIFVMSSVLYPYVYIPARAMFGLQSATTLEVARTLGAGPWRVFFRVALPLARPALVVGVTLVLMETLNDIGAVEYLGVKTLTFSIYDTWLNRGSLGGAAQLATVMLVIVFALITAERHARRHQRFHGASTKVRAATGYKLGGRMAALAFLACLTPVLIGFVVPAGMLADYTSRRLDTFLDPTVQRAALDSFLLAVAAALVTVAAGLVVAYAMRVSRTRVVAALARFASVGYAVPGTVLALGILVPLSGIDNLIDRTAKLLTGHGTGLVLIASGAGLVYAYFSRFLAAAFGSIESGLARVSVHLDMAARTLGRSGGRVLTEIHMPLIRPVLVSAGILVFVDAMKELPATLLLKPFNFETLATFVYAQASREAVADGAPAALLIVLVGLVPLVTLSRIGRGREARLSGRRTRARDTT